jgi:ABC-type sugar transport system substrate-binding protein
MFHGAGAIIQYYSGDWDYNLADTKYFKAACGNIGQEQPSGAVTMIAADETRFDSIETLVEYIKAHPGEIRVSYTTGTPHEVRIKLILNYFGIKKTDVQWVPGKAADIRVWVQGHTNTDVAIVTETNGAADVSGGKVKGILNSALVDAGLEVNEVDDQVGMWDQSKGNELVANSLAMYGDEIEVVFCNNDAMALGALQAIEGAGRTVGEDIYLVGVDALVEALQNVISGRFTGTVFNDHIAQADGAADAAINYLTGAGNEHYIGCDYVKAVAENAEDILALLQ